MIKFMSALKLAIVQGFNPNEISQREYASQVCVTRCQIQFWLRSYELHGEEVFQNSYTNYPVPFKLNVLNYMVQSGESLMETVALFKISSYTMVYSWKKQVASGGLEALGPKSKVHP
ncbi:helix-turn-helix domain-containing protein [Kurthia massiliensis]|uniref:helix-turn-helix domain-containing protein n=1 Tax=Kurthia massiliensis TaxID=1033739 RepID=UPI0002886DF6|nr:helix-turn-helix domain-containing protein [Kurthia massiliensis]